MTTCDPKTITQEWMPRKERRMIALSFVEDGKMPHHGVESWFEPPRTITFDPGRDSWSHIDSHRVGTAQKMVAHINGFRFDPWSEPTAIGAVCSLGHQVREAQPADEREWLVRNRNSYLGKWVALDGGALVAAGKSGADVFRRAKDAGVRVPFVHFIDEMQLPSAGL